jgi:MFS family permease
LDYGDPRHIKLNLGYDEFVVGLSALVFSFAAVSSRPVNYLGARRNRHELMFALMIMLTGSAVAIVSDNLIGVLFSRAFVGVADGLFYVAISTLVVANAGEKFKGRALNLYSVSLYLGITIGPIIGEQLYHLNKNLSFTLSGYACAAIAIALLIFLKFVPSRYTEHLESSKKHAAFVRLFFFLG